MIIDFNNSFINIAMGLSLMFFSQQFFWLFTGIICFIFGFKFTQLFFSEPSRFPFILAGIFCAFPGIVLSTALKAVAKFLAGALAGGFIAIHIFPAFMEAPEQVNWIIFNIGAVTGSLLLGIFFNFGLIFLSSLAGVMLVFDPYYTGTKTQNIIFAVLVIGSVLIQLLVSPKGETLDENA